MATFERRKLLSNEARVGILIIVAVVIAIVGVAFLREFSFKKDRYEIAALFTTVIGLDKDDPVIVSGLKVGKVAGFRLRKEDVEVTLDIDAAYRFPKDSKAFLKNLTLLGEKAIEIVRGDSTDLLPEGAVIQGTLQADIFELTEAAAPIGEDLAVLLKRLRSTFNEAAEANLQASLENVQTISGEIAQNMDQNLATLQTAMENASAAAKNLQELTNPENKDVDATLANLEESSANLKEATKTLRQSSASLQTILARLEKGEGAAGRFLTDEAIYRNLEKASSHLDSLILDVTKYPRKYLKVSVF